MHQTPWAGEWRDVKQRFTDNMLRAWASYAPNMTIDNVIATRGLVVLDKLDYCPANLHSGPGIGAAVAA